MAETLNFEEIAAMIEHSPAPRSNCYQMKGGVKPPYGDILNHLGKWQTREGVLPSLARPRVCLFAASHGVAEDSVTMTKARIVESAHGKAVINGLCELADAELRVYELDVENPTKDINETDAMDEAEAVRAIAYGMMAVEPGIDVIVLGSVGEGVDIASQKIVQTFNRKSKPSILGVLHVLRAQGGYDLCAMLGASIAARMAGIPILIDSIAGDTIKQALDAMKPNAGDHLHFISSEIFFKTSALQPHAAVTVLSTLKAVLKTLESILTPSQTEVEKVD